MPLPSTPSHNRRARRSPGSTRSMGSRKCRSSSRPRSGFVVGRRRPSQLATARDTSGSPGDPEALRMQEDDGSMPATHRPGLRVNSGITIPESELSWRFSRSSGPGGQGVNTADSRAELLWDAAGSAVLSPHQRERLLERLSDRLVDGVLTITASEHRAQLRNRDAARARLAAVVGDALRPASPPRRRTTPSRGAKERRLKAKKQRTDVKRLRRPPQD